MDKNSSYMPASLPEPHSETLPELFEKYTGKVPDSIETLTSSGSHRKYVRLRSGDVSLVGVEGTDPEENKAFFRLGSHFRSRGLNVPEVCAVSNDMMSYLQEDLGTVSLFDYIAPGRLSGNYDDSHRRMLRKTMAQLPAIQFGGAEGLDFSKCHPMKEFDRDSVMFDLHYFKYCFLKSTGLPFNEILLERDFEALAASLLRPFGNTFMYRDFQSRNVMIKDGEPYFIDFQDGRRGPIYYDIASFVWQARSAFPNELKDELIGEYLSALKKYQDVDEAIFRKRLGQFVFFRTLQVLGAYGFRGYQERKKHFLDSIPFAIANLAEIYQDQGHLCPYLCSVIEKMVSLPQFKPVGEPACANGGQLQVDVLSFSYKKGLPEDASGNGGGYLFDCRAIHNPGKYDEYKQLTGMDEPVRTFLETNGEVFPFLENVYGMVDAHVERFLRRNFTHLMVGFGCTGGQHRSVYCAEALASHLKEKFGVKVHLTHREQGVVRDL